MCEICCSNALTYSKNKSTKVYEEIFPGVQLIQAREDGLGLKKGQYALISSHFCEVIIDKIPEYDCTPEVYEAAFYKLSDRLLLPAKYGHKYYAAALEEGFVPYDESFADWLLDYLVLWVSDHEGIGRETDWEQYFK